MTFLATPAVSRKAWALKELTAPLVLGFLVFICSSKHPDAVGVWGEFHTNKLSFAKTVQNRTASGAEYPYDGLYGEKCDRRRKSGLGKLASLTCHSFHPHLESGNAGL